MSALAYCPTCEGGGVVPSLSGLTDEPCLCADLSTNDRVILHGRADTLADWTAQLDRTTNTLARRVLTEHIEAKRDSMIHLVAGCEGRCRGNSARAARCVL